MTAGIFLLGVNSSWQTTSTDHFQHKMKDKCVCVRLQRGEKLIFFPWHRDTFDLAWAFTLTSSRQRSYCFLWLSFSIDSAEFSAWADKTQTDKLRELLQLLLKEMQRYLKGSCLPAAPEDLQLHWRTWSCVFFLLNEWRFKFQTSDVSEGSERFSGVILLLAEVFTGQEAQSILELRRWLATEIINPVNLKSFLRCLVFTWSAVGSR